MRAAGARSSSYATAVAANHAVDVQRGERPCAVTSRAAGPAVTPPPPQQAIEPRGVPPDVPAATARGARRVTVPVALPPSPPAIHAAAPRSTP